jgi:dihydroflavonol-4-reductase
MPHYKDIFGLIAAAFDKKPPHKKVTPLLSGDCLAFRSHQSLFQRKRPIINKGNS